MLLDPNFLELHELFRAHEVRYLVVGGYAVAVHGHPRYTGDLDLWLLVERDNAERVARALGDFGFAALGLGPEDFLEPHRVVQLGDPPLRVDLLTGVDGVTFDACFARRFDVDIDGLVVPFVSLADLRRNKRASGRPQDLADLEALPEA